MWILVVQQGQTLGAFATTLNQIYLLTFMLALTYNTRSSTAYIYGTEFLPKSEKLNYGAFLFGISGLLQVVTPGFFYYYKSQTLYLIIMALLIFIAIAFIGIVTPESPMYLYEKGRFEDLE